MLDTAVYALSDLACLLGPAERVAAYASTLIPYRLTGDGGRVRSAVDDNVSVVLEYATGQQAVMRSCWGPAFMRRSTILYGRHGTIFLREGGRRVVIQSLLGPVVGATPIEFMGLSGCYTITPRPLEPEEEILGVFVDVIRGRVTSPCTGAQALHVIEQMMKGYESARSRRILDLETTFPLTWSRPEGLLDLSGPQFL
jgi:predicted dehydrogenase